MNVKVNEYGGEVKSRKGRKSTPKKEGGIESKRVEQYTPLGFGHLHYGYESLTIYREQNGKEYIDCYVN